MWLGLAGDRRCGLKLSAGGSVPGGQRFLWLGSTFCKAGELASQRELLRADLTPVAGRRCPVRWEMLCG